jgi:hypothetical protein
MEIFEPFSFNSLNRFDEISKNFKPVDLRELFKSYSWLIQQAERHSLYLGTDDFNKFDEQIKLAKDLLKRHKYNQRLVDKHLGYGPKTKGVKKKK